MNIILRLIAGVATVLSLHFFLAKIFLFGAGFGFGMMDRGVPFLMGLIGLCVMMISFILMLPGYLVLSLYGFVDPSISTDAYHISSAAGPVWGLLVFIVLSMKYSNQSE